ncbi:hypothetical protein BJY24_001781 [Nocardia transvalensis]|uniref:Uncharacterized protein n=1 Tax=Nocardia transvalensis TaxID=37333 RepID=A0A7W9PC56_9NOCA|nr:hypothetical protein [Nocardia transvalensis]MBB5912914.1 hypothetical protein [Nocardia transvalensis]
MTAGTIAIRLDQQNDDELRALARWLQDDEELQGRVRLREEPIREGQMGGVLDSVVVVLGSGTAAAATTSLFDWLSRKREATKITLTVRKPGGPEIELACGSTTAAREILGAVDEFLDEE